MPITKEQFLTPISRSTRHKDSRHRVNREIAIKQCLVTSELESKWKVEKINCYDDETGNTWVEERDICTRPEMTTVSVVTTCGIRHGAMLTVKLYGPQGLGVKCS